MGEEGTMTTQTGFSGGGADTGTGSAPTESAPSTTSAETSTTDSSATGGNSAIPPNAGAAKSAENTIAQSEKGSFVLRYNERTGRNEVVSTMPTETEPASEQQQTNAPERTASYGGDEMLQLLNNPQTQQIVQPPVNAEPVAPAPPPAQPITQQPAAEPEAESNVDNTAKAREFYSKVQQMAQERAMKEIGITQDEIDVAEYSDDPELLQKANAYKVAIENNRAQILQDVDSIQRRQMAAEEDTRRAYQTVVAFTNEMKQKEPNFDAIDKLMISRVAKMPYEEAVKIVPLIQKVRNNTLTTADLPALQEMYNQTRLEFYSNKTGVGLAPQVVNRPAFVETPGTGGEAPRQTTPLSALGKMSKRDREAAIGQMFGNFFDD